MSKKITKKEQARDLIIKGINLLNDSVKGTLGPKGRYVIIEENYGSPKITNDGVTVAKAVKTSDKEMQLGIDLIKEAAEKTDENVGDGTTSTAIITNSLVVNGNKYLKAGINPLPIINGMKFARNEIIKYIEKNKKDIKNNDEIISIAKISSKDEKIGKDIGLILQKVGKDGKATIEEGNQFKTEIDVIEGMHFNSGFVSPHMITDKSLQIAKYDNVALFIHDGKIDNIRNIIKMLEDCLKENKTLTIIAEEFSEEFIATMIMNSIQGIKFLAIKAPEFGDLRKEILEDIAVFSGTKVYSGSDKNIKELGLEDLGVIKSIKASKNKTILIEGNGSKKLIKNRVDEIKESLKIEKTDSLEKRLARLSGGIGVIKVGASTESELKTKKFRYEDALNAAQSALENGIVEGAGLILIKAVDKIDTSTLNEDEKKGVEIVKKAVEAPFIQIVKNSGENGELILNEIKINKFKKGYDALNNKFVNDMFNEGIIDPTNVSKNVINNSISVASLVLLTDTIITNIEDKNNEE